VDALVVDRTISYSKTGVHLGNRRQSANSLSLADMDSAICRGLLQKLVTAGSAEETLWNTVRAAGVRVTPSSGMWTRLAGTFSRWVHSWSRCAQRHPQRLVSCGNQPRCVNLINHHFAVVSL